MSEFCWQCMEEIFQTNGSKNDFNGLFTEPTWVLCEGCGEEILVDDLGKRVCRDSDLNAV